MKIGSIVLTVSDFEDSRTTWGLPYPKKGDVLTVSMISQHPNAKVSKQGIVLLNFEELPNMVGICDRPCGGKPHFVELTLPTDIEEVLSEPLYQSA